MSAWTSGKRSKEHFEWKANKQPFEQGEMKWSEGEPSAESNCVVLKLEKSLEESWVSTRACERTACLICEVYYFCSFEEAISN
jgi:hypothetical protein